MKNNFDVSKNQVLETEGKEILVQKDGSSCGVFTARFGLKFIFGGLDNAFDELKDDEKGENGNRARALRLEDLNLI